jgi:hypothetical protein
MVDNLREAHAGEVSALKTERHRLATQIGFATRADQAGLAPMPARTGRCPAA